jgi:hypothetical protein
MTDGFYRRFMIQSPVIEEAEIAVKRFLLKGHTN